MNVVTIGGGPAGSYFALLLKRLAPESNVVVLERDGRDDSFGWGVVFSDQTLENLRRADQESHDDIVRHFAHWDDIDVHVRGATITSSGHGFSGIARRTLLGVLRRRAESSGVDVQYHTAANAQRPSSTSRPVDLVVAADGAHSGLRAARTTHFATTLDRRAARYVWLGTTRRFDAFTFAFVERGDAVVQAHAYRFDEGQSAFIVECDERSWRLLGFDAADAAETVRRCEELFADTLEGHALIANFAPRQMAEPWQRFNVVRNERWYDEDVVLVGDAAHTAHFSIGSGTKLAMEDAIVLAREVATVARGESAMSDALERYQAERLTESLRLQNAARNSMQWFENVRRYLRLEPEQFVYSLLTRSQRVSHENLRLRDGRYLAGVERWFAARAFGHPPHSDHGDLEPAERHQSIPSEPLTSRGDAASAGAPPQRQDVSANAPLRDNSAAAWRRVVPPMFTPFTLRGLTLSNRVVVSPMDVYSATDGTPNDFHLAHYGARALGGAGLVMTEMTCVSPEARITLGCTGMYRDDHVEGWRRIAAMIHRWSGAKFCLQLGHSGAKGATRLLWEGVDEPLDRDHWETIAPSGVAYKEGMRAPREMSRDDMARVREQFAISAAMALDAGFDMLELHCAHGYLLSGFITPLSNKRTDEYGGSLENRLRFPLEVFRAIRAEWPEDRPVSVRISATDWTDDGLTDDESVEVARVFREAGADILHISTGQTTPRAKPVYGRMYQTPYADRIRNEAGVPTIAVGNITTADQVNSIIAAGRADLCALARPHLADPQWTLRAAAELGVEGVWPVQYLSGRVQFERELQRRDAGLK